MKGTEKIIARIQADADAQAAEILARADARCAEIRETYEQKAKEAYAERIRAGVRENQDRLDSMERLANMEGRKAILALKQDMVARSFERAVEKLVTLPEAQYIALLTKLAVGASVTGDEEIVLNARDGKTVGDKLIKAANEKLGGGHLRLAQDAGGFRGGLIMRRGNIEVNCTAELLVDLCREDMAAELAGVLFG